MDIEAIRKRNESRLADMRVVDLEFYRGERAAEDCRDLLNYIASLESRLQWKKIKDRMPEKGTPVLFRRNENFNPIVGFLYWRVDLSKLCWKNDYGFFGLEEYPEWREI